MPKNYTRITLTGAGGLDKTAVYLWRTPEEPRAVVQIVHGMREHMGRYGDFAAFLTAQGFAVCGHDHMGHGKSGTGESAFGYFGESDGPKRLVKDTHRITRLIQREYPGVPVFLLGHSMGSLIGRLYILHYPKEIAGFICMGTNGDNRMISIIRAMAEAAVRTRGSKAEGRMLDRMLFGSFNKRFTLDASRMAWLSRDPQAVEAFEWDALIRPYFTNSGFRDLLDISIAVNGKEWARRVDHTLPILLASGAEDPVGEYGKGVVQVYERLKLAGVLDVECKLYDGARHEILNELNREEVYYDLFSWMEDRLETE